MSRKPTIRTTMHCQQTSFISCLIYDHAPVEQEQYAINCVEDCAAICHAVNAKSMLIVVYFRLKRR